jgi:hypothetical protein
VSEARNAAHLAGMTKRKLALLRARRNTDSSSRPKFHLRSYCPYCPWVSLADPELNVYAKVMAAQRRASCRLGHKWNVRN